MVITICLTVSEVYYYIWIGVGLLIIIEKCVKGFGGTKRGRDE